MAVTTRFTERAGCRVPIQQAPMGSVSTPARPSPVAHAGRGGGGGVWWWRGGGGVRGEVALRGVGGGGIGDGRGFAAVLEGGAAGARVGTRFVATHESRAHPAYKQAVAGAVAGSTEITGAF